jgi:hypothetical protein
MILDGIESIIQEPEKLDSQIRFCEIRAMVSAKNGDRDISNIYNAIADNLKKMADLKPKKSLSEHDRYGSNQQHENQMDPTADQNGQHAPVSGKGTRQP